MTEDWRKKLDEMNQQLSLKKNQSDLRIINHPFRNKKRPEHSKKLKGTLTGDSNPATRPEVKEKIRNAALQQSEERSKRVKGDNNPSKKESVRAKIKESRKLQIMKPKYEYVMQSPKGKIFKGTTIPKMVELTKIPFEAIKHYMMSGKNPEKGPNLGWQFKRILINKGENK